MKLPSFSLRTIVEQIARRCAPRHEELVRAMISEMDSIVDPADRRRFTLGALAAVLRLAFSSYLETKMNLSAGRRGAQASLVYADTPLLLMPIPSTGQLLRRCLTAFTFALLVLTLLLIANTAGSAGRYLRADENNVEVGRLVEVLLLSLPAAIALTAPMAVFVAVLWVFSRLGRDGILAEARSDRHQVRRLVGPVLGIATLIAGLTLASNAELLPRANARWANIAGDRSGVLTSRSMTIPELRDAARSALSEGSPTGSARASMYEVEVQKKLALAASCLVLAIAGAAIAFRYPRGGLRLVVGASAIVFTGYYLSIVGGEALADAQLISPFLAMWMANGVLVGLSLLLVWRTRGLMPDAGAIAA